jgi:hypothetical protein
MKRASTRLFPLFALLLLAAGAGACSSYSYYDLTLKLGTGFDPVTVGSIVSCHVIVTGAASDDIVLDPGKCKTSTTGQIGQIEYSTFADSGSITFTFKAFQYPESNPACEVGEGATTLQAASGSRMTGMITATAPVPGKTGTCQ